MNLEQILPNKIVTLIIIVFILLSGFLISQNLIYIEIILIMIWLIVRTVKLERKSGKSLTDMPAFKYDIEKKDALFIIGWLAVTALQLSHFFMAITLCNFLSVLLYMSIASTYLFIILRRPKLTESGIVIRNTLYNWDAVKSAEWDKENESVLLLNVCQKQDKKIPAETKTLHIQPEIKSDIKYLLSKYYKP